MDSTFEDTFNKVGFQSSTSTFVSDISLPIESLCVTLLPFRQPSWVSSFWKLRKKIESELVEMEKRVKASEKAVIQSLVDQIKNVTIQLPRNYVQGS